MEIALHVNNLTSLRLFSEEPYHEWYAKRPGIQLKPCLVTALPPHAYGTCVWPGVWPGQIALPLCLKETGLHLRLHLFTRPILSVFLLFLYTRDFPLQYIRNNLTRRPSLHPVSKRHKRSPIFLIFSQCLLHMNSK